MAMVTSRRGSATASDPPRSRRAYWRAQVAAHAGSGLSVAALCHQRGLRKGTLTFWRWKFAQEAKARPHLAPSAFVPIRLAPARPPEVAPPAGELEIAVGSGRCVRVRGRVDPAWLAAVLRAVEARGC
jgi:hypothetical protein